MKIVCFYLKALGRIKAGYTSFCFIMVAPNGIEPSTQGFSVPCSTD